MFKIRNMTTKYIYQVILGLVIFTTSFHMVDAQVLINEFSAINTGAIEDFEGDYSDWIEIYNANSTSYNLAGHYISDDFTEPDKWEFPNITLAPNDRLLIFASGKNTLGNYYHTNFRLSSNGEEIIFINPNGVILDSIDYDGLEPNFSLGRITDGSDEWACFSTATPDADNSLSQGLAGCYIDAPTFSSEGGFYDEELQVNISPLAPDHLIYFTLDGSIPTTNSTLYETAIAIDSNTVIRAVNYDPSSGYFSLPETHTFFINENFNNAPVISISTDSCNLWSDEKGIYVSGPNAESEPPYYGSNFWENWEIPIHLEFFEDNQELAFDGRYDMKIHGGTSARAKAMKPLRILAKRKYGNPWIEYQVFKNKDADIFKRLVLRNSGSDFNQTMFRDGKVHDLVLQEGLNIDVSGYRPCIVFLNGEYWGLHNIREKVDEYYLISNYGIDVSQVDMLEENNDVIVGNFDIFNEHEAYILNNDLSIESNFNTAAAWFDLESFSDYFITQTFHNNYDWPNNNLKFWRERKDGAKWRYLLFDLDFGSNAVSPEEVDIDLVFFTLDSYKENNRHVRILLRFLENEEFKRYFINRYADLMNTSFSTSKQLFHLERIQSRIDAFITRHFNKWNTPVSDWQDHILNYLTPFFVERPAIIFEDVRNYFELENTIDLNFDVFPENAGTIQINTIAPESINFPWTGIYYKNLAIDLIANSNNNYIFLNWQNSKGEIIGNNILLQKAFENNETITAHFKDIRLINDLEITPNPSSNYLIANLYLPHHEEVNISIFDATGKLILNRNEGLHTSGVHSFPLNNLELASGIYFLKIQQGKFKVTEQFVVL